MFRDTAFLRRLFTLTLPFTLQNVMLALVAAADAFMLGAASQDAMAAVSLATQIQFIQNMLLAAIVCGIGILGAQYWGKKDLAAMGAIFGIGLRQTTVICVACFLGCFFWPEALMRLFAHDETLLRLGVDYLRIAAWSYLLTGASQCYLAIMKVSDHASRTAWISSGAVVLNIVLNALFIFGWFGLPKMGVRGAALATLLARVIELGWCVVSSYGRTFIRLRLKDVFTFNRVLVADFWHYTLPVFGAYLIWGVGFTAYTAIMGHLGPAAAAANAVAAVVRDLMCCVCNGLCGATVIVIGNELGAGRLQQGRLYGDRLMRLSFALGFANCLLVLALIPFLSACMKLDAQAMAYMKGMFAILAVYMIGRTVCTIVINGIFSAGGDTIFDVVSLVVFMWGIALPCAFASAFYFRLPVYVVYACTCLDEVGKVPWVICHYRKYLWVKNITR